MDIPSDAILDLTVMSEPQNKRKLTYLDLVNLCDNVRLDRNGKSNFEDEMLVPLYLTESTDSAIVGLLRPVIIEQLKAENTRSRELGKEEVWDIRVDEQAFRVLKNGRFGPSVCFREWIDTPTKRIAVMKEVCERWRDTGLFADVCGPKKWRNEMYAIYKNPFGQHDYPLKGGDERELNYAFEMERSACALFGAITYGIHMTIYQEVFDEQGKRGLKIWVPTRAKTKPTFPGMLDNTVAGGIPSGMGIFESLVKECMEEASLDAGLVRQYTRSAGAISYFYRTPKGWLQPEIEYVFDISIPPNVDAELFTPRPLDGEVECFEFMNKVEVIERLRDGQFKPNCGLVLIDLFLRLGYIDVDDEGDYMELCSRLHGRFVYGSW